MHVQEFTDDLWFNLFDRVTVFSKKDVRFTFKNGTEISVKERKQNTSGHLADCGMSGFLYVKLKC